MRTWRNIRWLAVAGCCCCLLAASRFPARAGVVTPASVHAQAATSTELRAAMAEYRRKLAEYTAARETFERSAQVYWDLIAQKRRERIAKRRAHEEIVLADYVLTQPPIYSGPPRPVNPAAPVPEIPPRARVPVVVDFLRDATEQFQFVPQRPAHEIDFKRAYAKVAAAAGLTKDQVVRIYGFEASGDGSYDVQAGLERPKANARAVSTALGYNQLLHTNTVELLAEQGDDFIGVLKKRAGALGEPAKAVLESKVAVLRRMIRFARSVPDSWSEHDRIANTPQGLGIHALNLDIDIGPLLQTQKLLDSILFARMKGSSRVLTAAELEMMNLTGDGNGHDMVTMPAEMRDKVPTANFFQRSGYERNPVAIRNNVVAKLLAVTDARMDQEIKLQGARELAAAFDAARSDRVLSPVTQRSDD